MIQAQIEVEGGEVVKSFAKQWTAKKVEKARIALNASVEALERTPWLNRRHTSKKEAR